MRIISVFLSYILFFITAGCSPKYDIHKSYAYSREMIAGTIQVDENNNPLSNGVQKIHLVYIETSNNVTKPSWDTAWIDGAVYLIEPLRITQDKINLGKTKDESREVIIEPSPEKVLWQLMLNPVSTMKTDDEMMQKINSKSITLSGLWKNKRVQKLIKAETALATLFGQ